MVADSFYCGKWLRLRHSSFVQQHPAVWRTDRWRTVTEPQEECIAWGVWKFAVPKPRSCSFCSSIHPEDALALLIAGWFVLPVDAAKWYLRQDIGNDVSPPVKLYKHHIHDDVTIARMQKIIRAKNLMVDEERLWAHFGLTPQ